MPHVSADRIEGVPTSTAALVGEAGQGPVEVPVPVSSLSEYQQTFGGPQGVEDLFIGISQFFSNGGKRAYVVRTGGRSLRALRRALSALEPVEDASLLCLVGRSGEAALAAGAAFARARGAFYVGDSARSRAATLEALRAIAPADAGHVAVYLPRLRVADPLNPSATRLCSASTSVAGLLARTDRETGVWTAAAGTGARIKGASGLASAIDDRAADLLRGHGVNVIREVPGHGLVVWGARTVGGGGESGAEWKYVPVRRLMLFLERSIYRGTAWAVFEPNDEPTWMRVRRSVELFLGELFQQGAFPGTTPPEAFFVRCGPDTMTRQDLNRGILVIEIGVAPLRPAEFVVLRIRRPRR